METKKFEQDMSAQEIIDVMLYSDIKAKKIMIQKFLERIEGWELEKKKFDELTPEELSAILEHHYIFDNHSIERNKEYDRYLILYAGEKWEAYEGEGWPGAKEVDKHYIPNQLEKIGDFGCQELLCRTIFYRGSCEGNGLREELFHRLIEPNFKDE